MHFYDALQLDTAILKTKIKNSCDKKEKNFFRAAMISRSVLIVLFAILFISVLSGIFGKENTPMAVALFCIMLSIRFVNFEYCIKDSLLNLAISFLILLFVPRIVIFVNPVFEAIIHFIAFFTVLYLTCQRPEFGNGGLYSFAYIYLVGNPVEGNVFINRALLTLVGYIICALILYRKHRHMHKEIRFKHIIKKFDLHNIVHIWFLRMALGMSIILTLGRAFGVERFMWMGFAGISLLSVYPYSQDSTTRFWQRIVGTLIGSAAFFIIFKITPDYLHTLIGPVGGLLLGFCTNYGYKTALNCFGALMIGAEIYGLNEAVLLRISDTIMGVIFGLIFAYIFHKFIALKFLSKCEY